MGTASFTRPGRTTVTARIPRVSKCVGVMGPQRGLVVRQSEVELGLRFDEPEEVERTLGDARFCKLLSGTSPEGLGCFEFGGAGVSAPAARAAKTPAAWRPCCARSVIPVICRMPGRLHRRRAPLRSLLGSGRGLWQGRRPWMRVGIQVRGRPMRAPYAAGRVMQPPGTFSAVTHRGAVVRAGGASRGVSMARLATTGTSARPRCPRRFEIGSSDRGV